MATMGTKRSFASMSADGTMDLPGVPSTNQEVLEPHQRLKTSTEETLSVDSSAHSTPRHTPAPTAGTPHGDVVRNFKSDASIVLIGMRGTGKSTLAIIASIACRRRIVEVETLFQEATGFSTAKYRRQFGAANYNLRQEELLDTILKQFARNAVIVCNGGSLERNGQLLIQEFARTHPVVYITRDTQSVCEYLGGVEPQRFEHMLAFTAPILRRCSNYEFANIAETRTIRATNAQPVSTTPAFLTLRRAQRTFLKFLSRIMSRGDASGPIGLATTPLEPGYPLSDVPTELRKCTYAVQVPLFDLLAEDVNVPQLEYGADAFEIAVDQLHTQHHPGKSQSYTMDDISNCISKVRRSTVVPIILHVLETAGKGDARESYPQLVRYGLRTAPDFITVDLSFEEETLAELIASRGTSKVIGHLHAEYTWDDEIWIQTCDKAVRLGCVLVRFTRVAIPTDDEYFLHNLRYSLKVRHSSIPFTCYNTGQSGRRSACFSQHLTPVTARPQIPAEVQHNPQKPCLTAREATQALYASFTLDPMQMYIIGAALEYTVSPAMHNAAYELVGLPHRFNRVQTSSLNSLKELVRQSNFGGSIVIQPYKVEVISLTDSLSQHARAIGAVNTLIPVRHLNPDNSVPSTLQLFQERNQAGPVQALYGDNTEWVGIRSCIRRGLSPANAVQPKSCALVIGAGGMARAAVYALLQLGLKNVVIFNRTVEKAERLVAHFQRLASSSTLPNSAFHILKSREDDWPENYCQPTIVISCIPTDPIDDGPAAQFTLPSSWMRSATGGVVMEVAYKTLNTPLMQQVQKEGSRWIYLDGLDFLPEQAFAQFELFTAKRAPRRRMREEVLRAWRDNQGDVDAETDKMLERRLRAIDDQEP